MNIQEEIRPVEDTEEEDAADEDDRISWGLEYDVFEDVASALEEFVRLNHVKRFVEAEELYRSCLSNHQDWFPVLAEFAEHLLLRRSYEELAEFSDHSLRVVKDSREMQVLIMMRVIADVHLKKSFQDAIIQTSIIWHCFPIDYKKTLPIDTEVSPSGMFLYIYPNRLILSLDSHSRAFTPGCGSYRRVLWPSTYKSRSFASISSRNRLEVFYNLVPSPT